jgi:hypothetical protein
MRCHATQAQCVVFDGLTVVECGEVELWTQLMHRQLLHMVIADPHGHDHVLGLHGYILLGDHQHHLQWYRATQGVENHHLLLLIRIAALDDALESLCLQLYLHLESPIRVIGHGEGRVDTPIAYLTNHPLDHDSIFRGVVIDLLPHHLLNKD